MLERVLRGGLVIDGRGGPGECLDVGLSGGRIAAIAPNLPVGGAQVIDVTGRVVAPAFIDAHCHSDLGIFADPTLLMKTAQGVGCEVFGQDGVSAAPVRPQDVARVRQALAGLDGDPPELVWDWRTVSDYLGRLERHPRSLDCCYLVPHGQLRREVCGDEDRFMTDAELERFQAVTREALEHGAVGASTGLIYPPCCFADTRELLALGEVLARFGRPLVAHLRSEGDQLIEAVEEFLDVGRQTGCPLHFSHIKVAGKRNWLKLDAMLDAIEEARTNGLTITGDQYPYTAGSTMMGALLPPWVHEGGAPAAVERLGDPAQRARMRAEMLHDGVNAWENFWAWSGPEGVVISDLPSGRHPEWVGRDVGDVAAAIGMDALEFTLDLLRDEALRVGMISHNQNAEVVARFWAREWVGGCTDGLLGGKPHPRTYGAFARMIAWLTRERGITTLPQAIRKMAAVPARAFGLRDLGTLEPGKRANIVVFDASLIADRSTWAEPRQYPIGIDLVLNGGEVVVDGGPPVRATEARPGVVHRAG
ncbi:D-aminoacylase [Myxococcota bacterium]|nr:D-aminoacylase [Myxococcota bacterium]